MKGKRAITSFGEHRHCEQRLLSFDFPAWLGHEGPKVVVCPSLERNQHANLLTSSILSGVNKGDIETRNGRNTKNLDRI